MYEKLINKLYNVMNVHIFLVEIGTEELPSRLLKRLGKNFFNQIISELKKSHIHINTAEWFASACHLAVKSEILIKKIRFSDDVRFVVNDCEHVNIEKREIYNDFSVKRDLFDNFIDNKRKLCFHETYIEFNDLSSFLFLVIKNTLRKLVNYHMMRWGDVTDAFIRPVRSITILLDSYLISGRIFNVNSDRVLYGNKCMKNNKLILIHARDYPEILKKQGKVIVDYNLRKMMIYTEIEKKSKELGGMIVSTYNDVLLEELTALAEWPVILFGCFDKKFLKLPCEIISHIMRYYQKCFPIYSSTEHMLLPFFIFVSNTISDNHQPIIIGYENVLQTRLMDAEFFFEIDSRCCLVDYIPKLDSVIFHRKLGTLREKSIRIQVLSGWIAEKINVDVLEAKRAGYLCKCDLVSHMVYEFPAMQGVIGMYYARRDHESESVVLAQKEHYYPRFSEDILPNNLISCVVSLSDKIDTISGIIGIKELPKGNRDPFALKRFAIGILRILIDKKLLLNLLDLVKQSVSLYKNQLINTAVITDVMRFMHQRLFAWYVDKKGYPRDIIKAVLGVPCVTLVDFNSRVNAVNDFFQLKNEKCVQFKSIHKRISNIFLKNSVLFDNEHVQYDLLQSSSEIKLFEQVFMIEEKLVLLLEQGLFYEVLCEITELYDNINIFFNTVMIVDYDVRIRMNRFMLLRKIKNLYSMIADFSFLCC